MSRMAVGCLLLASLARAEPDRAKEIDAYLARCERFGFSGSVLVLRDKKPVIERGCGLADRERGERAAPDTVFEIASATKPFTACAILKLAEMKKLSLDDPIGKHLPDVPKDKQGITIRHLLSHTSGMSRMGGGGGGDAAAAARSYLSKPLARKPGEAFEYWNGGYALLAAIVEQASGQSYMDFCRERLFRPAGLENTGFTGDADLAKQAVGYDGGQPVRQAAGHPYGDYGFQYRGMGGIVTSVQDLRRFLDAYENGTILSAQSRELMETSVTKNYGLGWGMAETKRGTLRIGHGGDVRGFHAEIERFPKERAAVLVLCNVEGIPLWTIAWNLEALLFGEAPPYPMPPAAVDLPPEALDRLAGRYGDVLVERQGNGLLVRGGPAAKFAKEIAAAEAVVEAVRRGDAKPVAAVLMEGIPKSWPTTLVKMIWPGHVERFGELKEAKTLGASELSPGRVRVLLELRHEKGTPCLEIVFQKGRLNIFRLDATREGVGTFYLPTGPSKFTGFSWDGEQPPPLRFEGEELVLPGVRARRSP